MYRKVKVADMLFPTQLKIKIYFMSENSIKSVIAYKLDCANANLRKINIYIAS